MARFTSLLVLGLCFQSCFGQGRPNVLMIMVDDLRPTVGAYGDPITRTPNIDRLAATGFLFENAFATVPVCGASRASLFSGRKPTTNRFTFFDSRVDEDLPGALTLPEHFRRNGYYTLASGKVFDDAADSPNSWSEPVWRPSGAWTSPIPPDTRGEDLQKAYLDNPDGVVGPAYERVEASDTDYPDGMLAEKTAADLQRLARLDSPFFLAVGFRKPHLPFNVPDRYWDIYDGVQFELPSTYRQRAPGTPPHPYHASFELRSYAGIPRSGPVSDEQAALLMHGYHAAVSYADAQVGKVLDALDAAGLADNTIVILLGDHGYSLGEHTMWTKHTLFDVALRTPLIIRDPTRGNGRIGAVVDFLDIFPTLVDLAGLPEVSGLDGTSLGSAIVTPSRPMDRTSISRWFDGASVRTPQFRYTEWRDEENKVGARMLFDIAADPDETRNLAEQAEYEDVVGRLSKLITEDDSNSPWSELVRRQVEARSSP